VKMNKLGQFLNSEFGNATISYLALGSNLMPKGLTKLGAYTLWERLYKALEPLGLVETIFVPHIRYEGDTLLTRRSELKASNIDPERVWEVVRKVTTEFYTNPPDSYIAKPPYGNSSEDCFGLSRYGHD